MYIIQAMVFIAREREGEEDCTNLEFRVTMGLDEAIQRKAVAAEVKGICFEYRADPNSERFIGITRASGKDSLAEYNIALGNGSRKHAEKAKSPSAA